MGLPALKAVILYGLTACISILFLSCTHEEQHSLPYYNSPDFTPLWLTDKKQVDSLHTVSPFNVIDQEGIQVTNKTFGGKIYVANFFFTSCPGLCPKMTKNLKILADTFKNDPRLNLISFSVTPEIDSVPKLKAYANRYGIRSAQWHFVTGSKAEIYKLARKSYFAEKEPGFNRDSTEFLHTEHFVLVDKNGHLRGIYNGTVRLEVDRLAEDIRELLKEN